MFEYSIEILHHFSCSRCRNWFTIGDLKIESGLILTCPHCGMQTTEFKKAKPLPKSFKVHRILACLSK